MTLAAELVSVSDDVWQRTRGRLDGLTDDEYHAEPVPGCWAVRQRSDQTWNADFVLPRPDIEPFTTLAWRLWHLTDMYGEDRAPLWLGLPKQGAPIGMDDPDGAPPATAIEALALLDRAHDRWDAHLHLIDDARLAEVVGPVGGDYADRTRAAYVLHMLDEFIHHGAEIALLRDLWRWQHPVFDDALRERVARGDRTVLADASARSRPGLIDHAAAYGRWELVAGLVEVGAPFAATGRTALHLAAGAGELEVIDLLVAHGAGIDAVDPDFHATPAQWASFLGHPEAAARLGELGTGR